MWHDQTWATSDVPATSARRRSPRDARTVLMSRTSCSSKPDMRREEVTAAATGAGAGDAIAIKGAPAAAEATGARRSLGGRKGDICDFPWPDKDKLPRGRSPPAALTRQAPRRCHADGAVRFPL